MRAGPSGSRAIVLFMRLLHTADWHLGRAFHGEDLLPAQAAFVDFLADAARERQPDAILVAGDLYDRALPPVDAVRLADEALSRLSELAPTIVVSGAEDPASPPERGEELAAAIRGASFVEIPEAAHLAPLERPAAVTGLLTLFLEGR